MDLLLVVRQLLVLLATERLVNLGQLLLTLLQLLQTENSPTSGEISLSYVGLKQGTGALQAPPPTPLARWTRLVSAPAVV